MPYAQSQPPPARSSESGQHIRPKALSHKPALEQRNAERLRRERVMAIVFGDLLDARRIRNTEAASWFGVVETVIRDLRARKCPISGMHLVQMPEDFAQALLTETRKRMDLNDALPVQVELLRVCDRAANDHYVR